MKLQDLIKKYQELSEDQKKEVDSLGYYSVTSGEHYGQYASFSLSVNGAEGGRFVPFHRVKTQKKYDRKGAKINGIFYPLIDKKSDDNQFKGFRFGKVMNIKYLKKKEGGEVTKDDLAKENFEYEKKETKVEKRELQKNKIQDMMQKL